MQTAGNLIAAAAELTAGVQHGQHRFDGALAGLGVDIGRDTAAVVDYRYAAVGQQVRLTLAVAWPARASSIPLSTISHTR